MIDQVTMAWKRLCLVGFAAGQGLPQKHRISQRWAQWSFCRKRFGNITETKDGKISGAGSAT